MVLLLLASSHAMAQEKSMAILIWALADSMGAKAKPVLVLLSTDWCRYCRMQKVQLEGNQDLQAAKNSFYFVEFDAETKGSVPFNGKVYRYRGSGLSSGIHELAIELGDWKRGNSYPLWVVLDKDYKVLMRWNGLLAPEQLKKIIEALSKTTQWEGI